MAAKGGFSILTRGFLAGTLSTAALASLYSYAFKQDIHVEYDESARKATDIDKKVKVRASTILKYGTPDRGPATRLYTNHVLSYNQERRIPMWVAEHLTRENLKGEASRKNSKFRRDPDIPEMFSSTNGDFSHSGWSRGHMAPAGDNKQTQEAMDESFYLSNVLPQDIHNNGGYWNLFEMYCRDLTKKFTDVFVISGPAFLPYEEDGKIYMKYQVLGKDTVAVPTHLYKVIVAENDNVRTLGVFIVPNEPIDAKHPLKGFEVPLENLESATGLHFLSKLDRASTRSLCEVEGCKLTVKEYIAERMKEEDLKRGRRQN